MTAKQLAKEYEKDVSKELFKYECLKDLDLFVLDNSIRESTVGQLRGHTIENKWEIFNEVTKCGFRHRIVASYNHQRRVDDGFVKELLAKGEDPEFLWAFSEVTEGNLFKLYTCHCLKPSHSERMCRASSVYILTIFPSNKIFKGYIKSP